MSAAIAAMIGGGLLSGIGSAAGARSQRNAQQAALDARQKLYDSLSPEEQRAIFGDVPDLPDYIPVDLTQSLLDTLRGNQKAFPGAAKLAAKVGEANLDIDLDRARKLLPGYDDIVKTQSENIAALTRGELPFSDVMDIISDSAQLSNRMGVAGSGIGTNATLRNLGLSRLEAQQTGQNLFQSFMQNAAQAISPLSRQGDVRDSFMTPAQRAQLDIQQRVQQFNAQTAQAHAAAMPDPAASQMFLAQVGDQSQAAALRNSGGAMWGALLQGLGGVATSAGSASNERQMQQNQLDAFKAMYASQRNPYTASPYANY